MSIENIFDILPDPAQNSLISTREINAVSGSQFIKNNINLTGKKREENILNEFLSGNMPNFLRKFHSITVTAGTNSITYLVMTDYLCVGHDDDYVRMPMNPLTAQIIADKYDCTLPTRKMVNDIWINSKNKLVPLPWGPPYDSSMMSTERYGIHNSRINNQLTGKDFTLLTSGHKKDVVLTNKLSPNNPNKRVAIYGWIQLNGNPIQGLNPASHEDTYADYSHGIRLVINDVMCNGSIRRIQDIFKDKELSNLISDEGVLTFDRY
jgi:hypothetical protein